MGSHDSFVFVVRLLYFVRVRLFVRLLIRLSLVWLRLVLLD